jgi:hypothetical protein
MSRRNKLLIIGGIVIVILIILLLLFFRSRAPGGSQNATNNPASNTIPSAEVIPPAAQQAAVEQHVQNAGVETVAKLFVERYGSYSTEARFQNIRDVMSLASARFATELQAQIDNAPAPTEYYGVTTVVLSVNVVSMDDAAGTAFASVSTQRTESKGSPQDHHVFYQTMELAFVKSGGEWKVESATWKQP